jgi:putative ATP-binding cassette transporter
MNSAAKQPRAAEEGTLAQTLELLKLLRRAPTKNKLVLYAALIVAVIVLNAVAQIRLNTWQGSFYDALAQRDLNMFFRELMVFGALVSVLLVLGVGQTWFHELLKVKLREAVIFDLIDEWLHPKRAYRMPLAGDIGVNPDQRIQDDARRLVELCIDLGVGLVQSTLLLVSFIGVLWVLSAQVIFVSGGKSFSIPGYMVWCAIAYALVGSYLTWKVGKPLIQANTDLRAREAEFRFLLVRVNESAEAIAIHRGEADEKDDLAAVARKVLAVMREIANDLARLNWVTASYGWIAIVAPIVVAAPGYFTGSMTFGGLMMVAGAFFQVQQSLRWFVDKFPMLAEWRATLMRVIAYRNVLIRVETLGHEQGLITYADHPEGKLSIEDLCVFAPNGRISLPERRLDVAPGERVLIAGSPRCGKSTYFRALAGLWVWGSGTIRLPKRGTMLFLPHKPYIPLGTLREALTYPFPPDRFGEEAIRAALARVRLARLTPSLDSDARWDQDLTLDEQQRIAIARAVLHKPDWIIQDEAMSELDDENRQLAISVFREELAHTALISIGRKRDNHGFYSRILDLQAQPPGLILPMGLGAVTQPPRDDEEINSTASAIMGKLPISG